MCEGEFESLKAIYNVSPSFVPYPYAWGKYYKANPEIYFLLAEFRNVGEQVCKFTFVLSSPKAQESTSQLHSSGLSLALPMSLDAKYTVLSLNLRTHKFITTSFVKTHTHQCF